jgi:predicted nucleotidyltransferase
VGGVTIIARHRAALRAETIAALRAHFAARPPTGAERVLLFGSVARGDFDGASDADILVIGDAWPADAPGAVLGRGVDVIHRTPAQWSRALAAGNPFAVAVAREGVEVWRAG